MINIQNYKPHSDATKDMLKENNFKYVDGFYSYRFPVYKNKKEPMLWCILYVDTENNLCNIHVADQNNTTYAAFFNREYGGKNQVVEQIDKKINAQLGTFVKNKILKKRGKR